jgi:hypothetical protein
MAKKSRRSRRKTSRNVSRGAAEAARVSPSTTDAAVAVPETAPVATAQKSSEYAYVVADLKRVAILAVGIFALLIALSFFIR